MFAMPPLVPAAAVKPALRVNPVPVIAPRLPPLTATSPLDPSHANVVPGSSLNVKLIVALAPIFNCATLLVIASVGATLSIVTARLADARLILPAASLALALIVCAPWPSVVAVMDQVPPSATADPTAVVPS